MCTTTKRKEKKQWMSTRDILWYLVFFGFAVNYMIRINLNIAIVSMVKTRPASNLTISTQCFEQTISTLDIDNKTQNNPKIIQDSSGDQFDWNEYQQGLILGGFYWLHWLTQIPGGILAQKYGTKLVFGVSNLLGVLLCFAMPFASHLGYQYLIVLRVLQGFVTGFAWPAMHHMTARWIPPNERSKFVTAYLGSSVGAAMTFPMCGFIIARWNWEFVFHVCGIIGCAWYLAWYLFVFDSPAEHPRISKDEKDFIIRSLGRSVSKEKSPVPWKSILTSLPVWLNILAQWGGIWGLFTAMTHAPTYFKVVHGLNIKSTGFLSGLPHLIRMLWAYIFSRLGDFLMSSNRMSRTNVRKFATFFSCVIHGICMLILSFSGCNAVLATVFLTAATAIHGSVSTGSLASFVDLSPNYASIQLGLSGMITVLPGFISPIIVGILTFNNQTAGQWQKVFWISGGMLIVPGILYLFFAKSELQDWNTPQKTIVIEEMKNLKGVNEEQEDTKEEVKEEVKEKTLMLEENGELKDKEHV